MSGAHAGRGCVENVGNRVCCLGLLSRVGRFGLFIHRASIVPAGVIKQLAEPAEAGEANPRIWLVFNVQASLLIKHPSR
jgi:hypothetical protein